MNAVQLDCVKPSWFLKGKVCLVNLKTLIKSKSKMTQVQVICLDCCNASDKVLHKRLLRKINRYMVKENDSLD